MNCPRCNAEVADSATFCQNCGTTLRSATSSFSYLPEGVPPWPSSSAQLPASVATLTRMGAQGATHNGVLAEVASAPEPTPPRPRRSARSVFAAAAILILAALVGVGLTLGSLYANGQIAAQAPVKPVTLPTVTATAATTPGATVSPTATGTTTSVLPAPLSFQSIDKTASGDLKASMEVPSDWQEETPQLNNGSAQIHFHPVQQLGIDFDIIRFSSADSASFTSPDNLNQTALSSFTSTQGISNVQSITPATSQRSLGGETWPEQDATFDVTNSGQTLQFHITSIATQHNKEYYNIVFYAPSVVYNEALQKYFQPIFDSFKFTA